MRARALSSAQPVGQGVDPANATAAAAFLDDLASQPESLRIQPPEASPADAVGMPAPVSETTEVRIEGPVYPEPDGCIQKLLPRFLSVVRAQVCSRSFQALVRQLT